MHILIGLILGCVLLYFWLAGNWFARVVTFLVCGATFSFVVIGIASDHHTSTPVVVFQVILVAALAWALSGILIWWRSSPVAAKDGSG